MTPYSQKGFSLIELMISSTLALVLLAVVVKLYQHYHSSYRYRESLAQIQESGRAAIQILQEGIHVAGYMGCGRLENENKDILPVEGAQDTITVRHMDTHTTELTSVPRRTTKTLYVADEKGLNEKDIIVIADCINRQVVSITHKQGKQITLDSAIKYPFDKNAQVGRLIESKFFVADTGRLNSIGRSIFALYWKDLSRKTEPSEMVEGIDKLDFRYGILVSGGRIIYQSASQIKDWDKVRTVQISLLLSGEYVKSREWKTQITLRERL